ncbi:MAG: efflux transporter outer membrane subunit [Candidatus Brocadiaceae bacterium]|nr:efflux transporter outer membrane subunit [Candidatus Brocadiaceae bacterium]
MGPDYTPPQIKLQDAWQQAGAKGLAEGKADIQTWWALFSDPSLNALIERSGQGNLALKEAFARIKEARAQRGIAAGERYPDIDAGGVALRKRSSHEFRPPTDQKGSTDDFFLLGGNASWEIDFWGKISRSIESSDASLQAAVEDYRNIFVMLYAEVALNYVEIRALQERISFASENANTQRKTLNLTRDRHEAGIAPELDIHQAELNVAKTESLIPDLHRLLTQAVNRLGVLLGQSPNALHAELTQPAPIPKPSDEIYVGLPADILRRRPDIRRAERELAAQTARIGVATADLYPSFSLFGSFTLAANDFDSVFEYSRSRSHMFGPVFRWNIFDGGRIRNQIKAEDARTEQALIHYEQTVLDALEDVENALVAYAKERERQGMLADSVDAAKKSVELVKILYLSGLTDFQNVLDMERALFEQQDTLAESEGETTQNLIRIYKALGGGWAPDSIQRTAGK